MSNCLVVVMLMQLLGVRAFRRAPPLISVLRMPPSRLIAAMTAHEEPQLIQGWEVHNPSKPAGAAVVPRDELGGSKERMAAMYDIRRREEVGAAARADADSKESIVALLTSKAVKGVASKTAAMLVAQFGVRTLQVLRGEGQPEDEALLRAMPRMGTATLAKIRSSLEDAERLREALDFGRSLGCLSEAQLYTLAAQYGADTEATVRANPYLLLDLFSGLSFGQVGGLALAYIHVHRHVHIHAPISIIHMCTCIHTHTHMHTHTYAHTHRWTSSPSSSSA